MKLKYIITFFIILFCLTACETNRQEGGAIKVFAPLGSANVEQPENAKEPAKLGYSEDGVTIPHDKGDELNVTITKEDNGIVKKEIEFGPKNFKITITDEDLAEFIKFIFPLANHDASKHLDLHPFNLSWGEKRRLNLSSLFSYKPLLYLFDEPFTGQDYKARKQLMVNIQSIYQKSGVTVFTSHDEDILQYCNRVFLLDKTGFKIFEKHEEIL